MELQLAWPAAWVAPRVDTKAVEEMVVSAAIQVQPGAARPMGAVGASCVQAVAAAEPAGEGPSLTVVRQACMRTLRVQERAAALAVARRDVHGACMPRRLRFEQQQHHQQDHAAKAALAQAERDWPVLKGPALSGRRQFWRAPPPFLLILPFVTQIFQIFFSKFCFVKFENFFQI